jgi:hypothetical protein
MVLVAAQHCLCSRRPDVNERPIPSKENRRSENASMFASRCVTNSVMTNTSTKKTSEQLPTRHSGSPGAVDGRTLGVAVHQVLACLFEGGELTASPIELRRLIGSHPALATASGVVRQAAKQRLLTASSVYLRLFAPEPDWVFIGAEVPLRRRRADLVWRTPGGIVVDELKAGATGARYERSDLDNQVDGLLAGAREVFGDELRGVRAIVLAAPMRSYELMSDGSRRSFSWGVDE